LEDARKLDEEPQSLRNTKPLFCVPLLVKDNIDTVGFPTSAGSKALLDNFPAQDAAIIQRLKAAGAIILAKTNMAEWAFSPRNTVSSSYGVTANAYDRARTPAGSSGGTASGIAASFGLAGLGTDTGNSVRGPSSFTSLVGMRPSLGLVSRSGIIPLELDRDTAGPMTRSVEDNARILSIISGEDGADSITQNRAARAKVEYIKFLKRDASKSARIGVLRALAPVEDTDPKVLATFNRAIEELKAAGATIVEAVEIPNLKIHLNDGYYCSRFAFDVNTTLAKAHSPSKVKDVESVYQAGLYAPQNEYDFKRFLKNSKSDPGTTCPYMLDHPGRAAFLKDVEAAMDGAELDALIYPTWRFPPPAQENATSQYKGDNSQLISPATGMPAITVPVGFTDGLPVGLQMLGRRFDEGRLYGLAYSYEQHTHWRKPPDGLDPLEAVPGTDK
jgi:Asp-tRNA(Asn)/Glu-tRNA(Gln) amidotransferase A subunit family amidase